MEQYIQQTGCPCGKTHTAQIDQILTGKGVLAQLPQIVARFGAKKPYVVADQNTYAAAGEQVCGLLEESGIGYQLYVYADTSLKPDEHAVGAAIMHFDRGCDMVIGVGSGVINDICKIVSHVSGLPFLIVATAPSMDGYASASSSMERDGLKVSLSTRCADVILGDTDILKNAPMEMLRAGIGDMLAKYVSIAEWRIAKLLCGEYYCEAVAQLIRDALKKCTDNAQGLLRREDAAVEAVFEGLVIGGVAMTYAGLSRPASGVEHYFSHVQDMRGLEFGTPTQLHGIQCARATAATIRLYEQLSGMQPDGEKALAYVRSYDPESWNRELKAFLGKGADAMIAQEKREGKYDPQKHAKRLPLILENWDTILRILREELPDAKEFEQLMAVIGIPAELNADAETARMMFKATKDIRDKYVLSRLAWDLGILEELAQKL